MATTNIFVNLPVDDLDASKAFYTGLGYSLNANFTDEKAACVQLSESIFLMLLVKPFFGTFTDKEIGDPRRQALTLNSLGVDSRDEVDALATRAATSGGAELGEAEDLGFMYSRDIEDPDGHAWQVMWMDPAAAAGGPPSE